jgi:ribonucleoside-diphosphate reductase beta chain
MEKTYTIGNKTFVLDEEKAVRAYQEKMVINGRASEAFNLLPLKYQWAYDLYRKMKANHWEPEDVPMQKDLEQWKSSTELSDAERWIIMMGIGYFSAAEGIVGDNIQHVVRELVTAPELKLVLGRHAHEENIHADSLLYMISSLGINPTSARRCSSRLIPFAEKTNSSPKFPKSLRRDLDLTQTLKARVCEKYFCFRAMHGRHPVLWLFGMILSLARQNKFPGSDKCFATPSG